METVADFIFLGSKITADSDCSHEISPPFTLTEHTLFQFPFFLVLIHVKSFCLVPKCLVYFTSIYPPDSGLKVVSKITFLINFMSKLPSGSI